MSTKEVPIEKSSSWFHKCVTVIVLAVIVGYAIIQNDKNISLGKSMTEYRNELKDVKEEVEYLRKEKQSMETKIAGLTLNLKDVVTCGANGLSDSNKENPLIWTILRQLEQLETKIKEKDEKQIERFSCDNKIEKKLADLSKSILQLENEQKAEKQKQQNRSTGPTYIRWGRSSCGDDTETVYTGQVGGNHYKHPGGSVNYICLPNDPDSASALPSTGPFSYLYGGEYEVFDGQNKPTQLKNGLLNHDVPCALCNVKGRTTAIMIPGRRRCYNGWREEYSGYLMAGHYNHPAASEYACVDKDPETMNGGSSNLNGILFYPVTTVCGSLKCPPYVGSTEVLCVVCSK